MLKKYLMNKRINVLNASSGANLLKASPQILSKAEPCIHVAKLS